MMAFESGIRPCINLEDTTKADIHGWVIPFMQRVMKETDEQACFRICDTVGWGVPDWQDVKIKNTHYRMLDFGNGFKLLYRLKVKTSQVAKTDKELF